MNHRPIVFGVLLSGFVISSAAQERNGLIDLEVVSNSPLATTVSAHVLFAETDDQCPELHGMLRILHREDPQSAMSGGIPLIPPGTLELIQSLTPDPQSAAPGARATMGPADDETQRLRAEASTCRVDIAVRQQVRRTGSWDSLLAPRLERPSLPLEERRELQRQLLLSRTPKEPAPSSQEMLGRQTVAGREWLAWHGAAELPSVRWLFVFEDRPEVCFEAVGDFHLARSGLRFSFLTHLPGDMNRFVIERMNLDANRRRLHFTRGDCRFELTINRSVLRDGRWTSVPLVPIMPIAPPKG